MAMRISLGSGATLATQLVDGAHMQIISGVTLNPSPSFIGLVTTVPGAVQPVSDNSGSLTVDWLSGATVAVSNIPNLTIGSALPAGTNFIGLATVTVGNTQNSLVTINNFPATQAVSFNQLVSLASGTEVRSLATILNQPPLVTSTAYIGLASVNIGGTLPALSAGANFIGLVSVQGNVNAAQSGTWTVQPGNTANTTPWLVTQTSGLISLASGTFVSLNPGTNHIGSVSIFGNVTANTGMTTLFPGPNFIGLVTTVQGNSIPAGTNHIGSVSIFGSVTANTGMTTLFPGPNFIGLVTTVPGAVQPINDNSGSITVDNAGTFAVQVDGNALTALQKIDDPVLVDDAAFTPATSSVMMAGFEFDDSSPDSVDEGDAGAARMSSRREVYVQLRDAAGNERGLNIDANNRITANAVQGGTWTVQPGNTANTTPWLVTQSGGLISLASGTFVSLNTGTNFVGLVSVQGNVNVNSGATVTQTFPPITSLYTSLATVISASGNATLFTPPNSQRWVLKDLIIGSQGSTQVGILSGTITKIPPIALATMGGYISNFGDSGLRATAADQAFVVVNNSAATISVTANVRFEA